MTPHLTPSTGCRIIFQLSASAPSKQIDSNGLRVYKTGAVRNVKLNTHNKMKLLVPDNKKLLPFQEKAIQETLHFLNNNPANACYNACEMGLGKTVQAIVCANSLGFDAASHAQVLIICPAIMRLVWKGELEKWALYYKNTDSGFPYVVGSRSHLPTLEKLKPNYVIISYDMAASAEGVEVLTSQRWDMLILDEAHYLKNTKAKRTKAVLQKIWKKCQYKLALSGTPFTTRVVDGYTLFTRMIPGRWPDFASFADEFSFCTTKYFGGRKVLDYFGVKNPDVLRNIIRNSFYVRYTKEEVLKDLPSKVFNKIPLPITYAVLPQARSEKDVLMLEAAAIKKAVEGGKLPPVPASLAEHRRLQGERKVEAVADFAKDLLDQDVPVVIFAWHKSVIAGLQQALGAYKPEVITGDTQPSVRQKAVERFQSGQSTCFIGNYVAAGVGITLTASSTVLLAEEDWVPANIMQAVDRCHRIGQKDTVNVYYFVVQGSIDEQIAQVVIERIQTFKQVLE